MFSDVMSDAIIVERSKLEPADRVGQMQGVGYMCRYTGNILGSILGTVSGGGGGSVCDGSSGVYRALQEYRR